MLIGGATSQTCSPTTFGVYTVQVTLNGCSSPVSDDYTYIPVSVPDIDVISQNIRIFPSPEKNKPVIVNTGTAILQAIRLFDIIGKPLAQVETSGAIVEINMEKFSSGMYVLRIENRRNDISGKKKIIKQ